MTTAITADIARRINEADDDDYEPAAEGFRSQHDHTMHACGHDAHITIGLGTAKLLAEMKDAWSGTLKIIFQPAEEGVRGGKSIVAKGHCDDVDFMLAQHVDEKSQDGDICAGAGGALATTKMDVNFFGRSAHASGAPEEGRNVVPAVATAILNLYAISRHSHGPSRINVGKVIIDGGRNIIADKVHLEIEVRGETTEINDYMEKRARTVIAAAADMYQLEHEMIRMGESISLDSDRDLMARIDAVATDLGLIPRDPNWMMASGSEDYAFMMDRVQSNGGKATFIRMLTSSPAGHTIASSASRKRYSRPGCASSRAPRLISCRAAKTELVVSGPGYRAHLHAGAARDHWLAHPAVGENCPKTLAKSSMYGTLET